MSGYDDHNDEYRNRKIIRTKILWVLILSLVLALLILTGFLLDRLAGNKGEYFVATPTPTPVNGREVTPTPVPTKDPALITPLPTETPTPTPAEPETTPAPTPTDIGGVVLTPTPTEPVEHDFTPWVSDDTEDKEKQQELQQEILKAGGFIPIAELFPNLATYFKRDKVTGIELGWIDQNPELPSGCESVSLTMVLNYYGFDLKKTDISDRYMIYGDNFVTSFEGNPYSKQGGAVFAPGLATVANIILSERESTLKAEDVSGTDFETLITEYIYHYVPVVIYTTTDYGKVSYYDAVRTYNGREYHAVRRGHCVVLAGYDETDNSVILYDPISGVIKVDKEKVKSIYDDFYQMAVVVK